MKETIELTEDNQDLLPKDVEDYQTKDIKNLLPKDKEDCFIFLGETGTGKTSIINLLCGSNNSIGDGLNGETKNIIKEKGEYSNTDNKEQKKYYYCLDTQGLNDPEKSNQKMDIYIRDYLDKEKDIKIMGVIFCY